MPSRHTNSQRPQNSLSRKSFSYSFPNGQKQPITHIPQARSDHSSRIHVLIHASHPNFYLRIIHALFTCPLDPLLTPEHSYQNHFFDTPLEQCLDGSNGGATGSDYRVKHKGNRGRRGAGAMVWEVVVVFDGLERGRFTKEAEVVDGYGIRKERLDGCGDGVRWVVGRNGAKYLRACLSQSVGLGQDTLGGIWSRPCKRSREEFQPKEWTSAPI